MAAKNRNGVTLIEVLIVLVILVILAGASVSVLTRFIDDAQEKVCVANRSTVLRLYKFARTADRGLTLSDYLEADEYKSELIFNDSLCPSDGLFSAGDGTMICCSKHLSGTHAGDPDDSDDDDVAFTVDGKKVLLSVFWENILANHAAGYNTPLEKGDIVGNEVDGYYIVRSNYSANNSLEYESFAEFMVSSAAAVSRVNHTVAPQEYTAGMTAEKGNIYIYEGKYYVCTDEGVKKNPKDGSGEKAWTALSDLN